METNGATNHNLSMEPNDQPILDQTRTVGEEVTRLGRVARDEAKDRLTLAKESTRDLVDRGKQTAQRWETQAESAIQDRPFRATALAAGVGVAVGLLLRNVWKSR